MSLWFLSQHHVALSECPLTLILSIASLDFLMMTFLHLSLQYSRPCGLVIVGDFQNVGGIDEVIVATAHDMVAVDVEFEDRYLAATCVTILPLKLLKS